MRYNNLYSGLVKISENGNYHLESSWQLITDNENSSQQKLREECELWAGDIGDNFREVSTSTNSDGEYFQYNENLVVSAIELKIVDCRSAIVTFTGKITNAILDITETTKETYQENGILIRTISYTVLKGQVNNRYLPNIGTIISWDDGTFVCSNCSSEKDENGNIKYSITGQEVSTLQLGEVEYYINAERQEIKKVNFFVAKSNRETFSNNYVHDELATWAGDDYVLLNVNVKPYNSTGVLFTLEARKIVTRMVSSERTETFAGINANGNSIRKIVWKSNWLVKTEDIQSFYSIAGTVPTTWAEENSIITKVEPNQISNHEYEVKIEAQSKDNPELYNFIDEKYDLDLRTEVSVIMIDFYVHAEMAGYVRNSDGKYSEIIDWDHDNMCPFETSGALSENMIEANTRTLAITEITYHQGSAKSQINSMLSWAKTRLYEGNVAGKSATYLKISQRCSEIYDNKGNLYTKLSRTYQTSPGNFVWSSTYWANH